MKLTEITDRALNSVNKFGWTKTSSSGVQIVMSYYFCLPWTSHKIPRHHNNRETLCDIAAVKLENLPAM